MNAPALLGARGLACRRGDRLLWRGIDLAVAPGAALLVVGANGSGKSSLLRVLAGLLPACDGTVTRGGRAAFLDENTALDPARPLADALLFWAAIDGGGRADVGHALAAMAMDALAAAPLRLLSTGQRQRAAIARLLLADAPLWLLDEPGNGLDTAGLALLEQRIAAHRAGGGGVILTSHLPLALPGATTLAVADFRP